MKKKAYYRGPFGILCLEEDEGMLVSCNWVDDTLCEDCGGNITGGGVLEETIRQLGEYFAGVRRDFDLPVRLSGTDFQQRVWRRLESVPYGTTASYADIARGIGCEKGVRAVAQACRRNPVGIIVPCHRIIGSDGSLTGYAGGLDKKQALLRLEGLF